MSGPYARRRDPQPLSQGWEVPVAVLGGIVLGVGLAALCGLGLACALFGGGWVWPHGTDTIDHVLGGLLTGHPGRGLPAAQARLVPGSTPIYACVAVCELALATLAVTVGVLIARYRRPGDARSGMASRAETQRVLGIATLRSARTIIRPDLYPPRGARQVAPSTNPPGHPQITESMPIPARSRARLITSRFHRHQHPKESP